MTTWAWLGDHLALDVANTIRWSDGETRVELWCGPEDLDAWLEAEPVRLPRPKRVSTQQWSRLVALRDDIVRLLDAAASGDALPPDAVAAVNETIRTTGTTRLLEDRVGVALASPATDDAFEALRGRFAAAAVDLLARDDLANLARCHAPDCGQFFHRSRPNQRWCSPGCGNRARVDRHRHRIARTTADASAS